MRAQRGRTTRHQAAQVNTAVWEEWQEEHSLGSAEGKSWLTAGQCRGHEESKMRTTKQKAAGVRIPVDDAQAVPHPMPVCPL